jgi:glycosyltransferase involved in cell wall biosynthesis
VITALPEVANVHRNVRYLLVGGGDDGERLSKLASSLGVAERVTLCGFVPDAELAAHYRLADVFAMPSTGEGFGIVFLEAMGCGVPVLAGNRDGAVDALVGGELGCLVDPTDAKAVARGLLRLLSGRGPEHWFRAEALSAACRQRFGRTAFKASVAQALSESMPRQARTP